MKKTNLFVATALATAAMAFTAWGGQWMQNATGWWYDYGNGTWPASSWQWIDGNGDGIAECYYFDQYGYMAANTTTPDGYTVDASGAWTVNGAVQTRSVTGTAADNGGNNNNTQVSNVDPVNLSDMDPVAKSYYRQSENVRTNQNALWGDALEFTWSDAYAEFFVGGQYNTLSLTAAPKQGFGEKNDYTLEIYGDDDTLLDYYDFNYKSSPKEISVDISGQQYVKLFWLRNDGYSNYSNLLMKNAQFR